MIHQRIIDSKILKVYKKLSKQIVKEHFKLTLPYDRNFNFIWYMYSKGPKKDHLADFIVVAEINLIRGLKLISNEVHDNLINMLLSPYEDNIFMALLSIDTLRKDRIKQFGSYSNTEKNSEALEEIARNYSYKILTPSTFKHDLDGIIFKKRT